MAKKKEETEVIEAIETKQEKQSPAKGLIEKLESHLNGFHVLSEDDKKDILSFLKSL